MHIRNKQYKNFSKIFKQPSQQKSLGNIQKTSCQISTKISLIQDKIILILKKEQK